MRELHRLRFCESCQARMARDDESCWRCGAVWATHAAAKPDDGSSLRARTAHVLDARARRRAARARHSPEIDAATTFDREQVAHNVITQRRLAEPR